MSSLTVWFLSAINVGLDVATFLLLLISFVVWRVLRAPETIHAASVRTRLSQRIRRFFLDFGHNIDPSMISFLTFLLMKFITPLLRPTGRRFLSSTIPIQEAERGALLQAPFLFSKLATSRRSSRFPYKVWFPGHPPNSKHPLAPHFFRVGEKIPMSSPFFFLVFACCSGESTLNYCSSRGKFSRSVPVGWSHQTPCFRVPPPRLQKETASPPFPRSFLVGRVAIPLMNGLPRSFTIRSLFTLMNLPPS